MLRIDAGLSRYALATAVGVSHHTIARLEEGDLPGEAVALKVARHFEMKPTELWPELAEDRETAA